ncbi:ATP-dependent RecD-like DNA helicase [Vibrio sp. B1Z05]|uniref:ATP-dependent DNA helicase n=1 Tax=Vibrio sp. B1Z05 TaxID=2654980 RepID=UPI00128D28B2|nr:AAA family ATPase [Vibrio sp. B1Z05]MPW37310.1 AAA family ATPase [Vibrio sp. B1Z05]
MAISNFSFLQQDYAKLAELGKQAESYLFNDPQTTAFKLRAFTELLVEYICNHLDIDLDARSSQLDRLKDWKLKQAVSEDILGKLHSVRKLGNKAVHNELDVSVYHATWLIEECYLIGRWFIQTMQSNYVFVPEFQTLARQEPAVASLKKDNQKLQQEVESRAKAIQQTQDELDAIKVELHKAKTAQLSAEAQAEKLRVFKQASVEAARSFDLKMEETRKRVSIFDSFENVELTKGQRIALEQMQAYLESDQLDSFILHGYAGTGKTFITKGLVEYLKAYGRNCVLLAPTGKAAKVISEKTGTSAATIHSAIYSFKNAKLLSEDEMEIPLAQLKRNLDSDETVYIIDEASMLSNAFTQSDSIQFGSGHLLDDLIKYTKDSLEKVALASPRKIIFIGDHAQLPPVSMSFSPALQAQYLNDKYELRVSEAHLNEVVRQKVGSGVMDNAVMLRSSIDEGVFNQLNFDTDKPDIESITADGAIDQYMALCRSTIAQTKEVMLVASSNSQVKVYNDLCRQHFFPNKYELCPRDKVISVANHYREDITVTNGEFGMVKQVLSAPEKKSVYFKKKVDGKTESVNVDLYFRDVELVFRDETLQPKVIKAKILENLLYNSEPSLTPDENRALTIEFMQRHRGLNRDELEIRREKDPYFNAFKLKFGYAITCHKAQGSEWKHVIVKCSSHLKILTKEYFRWLYTAITRTSSMLYVVDEPKIRLGGNTQIVGGQDLVFEQSAANLSVVNSVNPEQAHQFGISDNQPILKDLLRKVQACIQDSGIEVCNIRHYQYQELYRFKHADAVAEVQFNYNGKNKVSSFNVRETGLLQTLLQQLLTEVKGVTLSTISTDTIQEQYSFTEPFLEQFHSRISEVFSRHDIKVSNLDQIAWTQRYTLTKYGDTAVIDFFYNGKKQFTKVYPKQDLSSSSHLLAESLKIWSNS